MLHFSKRWIEVDVKQLSDLEWVYQVLGLSQADGESDTAYLERLLGEQYHAELVMVARRYGLDVSGTSPIEGLRAALFDTLRALLTQQGIALDTEFTRDGQQWKVTSIKVQNLHGRRYGTTEWPMLVVQYRKVLADGTLESRNPRRIEATELLAVMGYIPERKRKW